MDFRLKVPSEVLQAYLLKGRLRKPLMKQRPISGFPSVQEAEYHNPNSGLLTTTVTDILIAARLRAHCHRIIQSNKNHLSSSYALLDEPFLQTCFHHR
jgi:hypothetical protein